jgi:cob(I)alamin adenosyltransferase
MKIYTKTGDKGQTGLFNGQRVSKAALRVEAYGTVDELNTIIGLARSENLPEELENHLRKISNLLFNLGSDLASPLDPPPKFEVIRLDGKSIEFLEKLIDKYDEELEPLRTFILPGGSRQAALLHQARTVCRRAERLIVRLSENEDIGDNPVIFINRLSDYLFTAARYANKLAGRDDIKWEKS